MAEIPANILSRADGFAECTVIFGGLVVDRDARPSVLHSARVVLFLISGTVRNNIGKGFIGLLSYVPRR